MVFHGEQKGPRAVSTCGNAPGCRDGCGVDAVGARARGEAASMSVDRAYNKISGMQSTCDSVARRPVRFDRAPHSSGIVFLGALLSAKAGPEFRSFMNAPRRNQVETYD